VERDDDWPVCASNLSGEPVQFDLRIDGESGAIQDLRSLVKVPGGHVKLRPYQETIFRIEKLKTSGIEK
jgi:hypothetical protein